MNQSPARDAKVETQDFKIDERISFRVGFALVSYIYHGAHDLFQTIVCQCFRVEVV